MRRAGLPLDEIRGAENADETVSGVFDMSSQKKKKSLNLFNLDGGGGEGILTAAALDVNIITFFNVKKNATKLGDFL